MPGSFKVIRDRLGYLGSEDAKAEMRAALAVVATRETLKGFRESRDPYGEAWKGIARPGKPEIDTGNLRASLATELTSTGFNIGLRAPYASYQQFGTRPHARKGGILRQNARGRFVKRSARTAYLTRFKGYTNGGITARPMLPTDDLGGLPPRWFTLFNRTAKSLLAQRSKI